MTKLKKYGLAATITTGVAGIVAIPTVIAIKNKQTVFGHVPGLSENIFNGMTVDGAHKAIEGKREPKTNIIPQAQKSIDFFQYNLEQPGSIELQKMDFKYNYFVKEQSIKKIKKDSDAHSQDKEKVKNNKEKIKELEKKQQEIKKLLKTLEQPNVLDYNDDDFHSTYPQILMPIKFLKNQKKIKLSEEKNGFMDGHKFKGDAEKAWIEELRTKYNGAITDDEAADQMVSNDVSEKSQGKYKYSINSSYTFNHMVAKYNNERIYDFFPFENNKPKFKTNVFISKEIEKIDMDTATDTQKEKKRKAKIYFMGSKSLIPKEILKPIIKQDAAIQNIVHKNFSVIQHALFNIHINSNSPDLSWKVTRKQIDNLLYFMPGKKRRVEQLLDLFKRDDSDDTKDNKLLMETKNFIANATDNGGTKNNSGILKTGNLNNNLKGWYPGFTLGTLNMLKNKPSTANDDPYNPETGMKKIQELIKKLEEKIPDTQEKTNNFLKSMSDYNFQNKFGTIFKDVFCGKDKGAHDLSIRFRSTSTQDSYILFTNEKNGGIHFVNIKKYTTPESVVNKIKKDMQGMADNLKEKKNILDFKSLFKDFYTDTNKFDLMLENKEFIFEMKKGYEKSKSSKKWYDFPDQLNPKKTDTKYTWSELIDSKKGIFKLEIDRENKSKNYQDSLEILGQSIEKYMYPGYDNETLKFTNNSSPKSIYEEIINIGNGK